MKEQEEFKKRLDKALKINFCEDERPKTGIWYYLWKKPNWKLWTFPRGSLYHYEAWQTLAEELGSYYHLTEEQIEQLKELPYGLPRGRVDTSDSALELGIIPSETGKYFLLHGDDFPFDKESEIRKIISLFNLTNFAVRGQVSEKVVEHETMLPKQVEEIQKILGPIPYRR